MTKKGSRSETAPGRTSPVLAIAIALIVVALAATFEWKETDKTVGLDFYQFWMGGQAISRTDIANFYDRSTAEWIGNTFLAKARAEEPTELRIEAAEARQKPEFYSTPVLYAFFSLFPTHYETAYYRYVALLLIALIGGIVLLGRTFGVSLSISLWFAAAVLLLFEPVMSEFRVLNVNALQFFAVALFIALRPIPFRRARAAAGAILAAAILFKPNLALIVPFSLLLLLAAGRFKLAVEESAGYVAGAIVAIGGAAAHSSFASWSKWWSAFRSMPADIITVELGNISPRQFLDSSIPRSGLILGIALVLATAILTARAARNHGEDTPFGQLEALAASLALVLMFYVASPMWIHYAVLALPLILWLLAAPVQRNRGILRAAGAVSAVLVAFTPFLIFIRASNGSRMFLINAGLAVAVASALVVLWQAGDRRGTATTDGRAATRQQRRTQAA